MREKKIRRRLPCGEFELGALGHWLGDLAEEGLRLERINSRRAVFRQAEPKPLRYRFYPCREPGGEPSAEQRELFRELGWEYATTLQNELAVFCCADPAAPELCTDPVVEAETYRDCDRKFLQSLVWMLAEPFLSLLLYLGLNGMLYGGMMNGALWRSRMSLTHLFAGGFEISLALLLFFAAIWSGAVLRFRKIHALRRRLARGEPTDYQAPYRSRRGVSVRELEGAATALLFLSLICLNCIDRQEFPAVSEPVPAPLLSRMEGEGFRYGDRASMTSRVERKATLLAELFCETRQSGEEPLLWLDSTYIRARFPGLAGPLFDALAETGRADGTDTAIFGEPQTAAVEDGRFDGLECLKRQRVYPDGTGNHLWTVTARRGDQVICASYSGEQPLSRLLDELDDTLKRFEEGEP